MTQLCLAVSYFPLALLLCTAEDRAQLHAVDSFLAARLWITSQLEYFHWNKSTRIVCIYI